MKNKTEDKMIVNEIITAVLEEIATELNLEFTDNTVRWNIGDVSIKTSQKYRSGSAESLCLKAGYHDRKNKRIEYSAVKSITDLKTKLKKAIIGLQEWKVAKDVRDAEYRKRQTEASEKRTDRLEVLREIGKKAGIQKYAISEDRHSTEKFHVELSYEKMQEVLLFLAAQEATV